MVETAPPVAIPRIPAPRVLLRELRKSDFESYAENLTDPIATKFLSGVLDRRSAWRLFAASTGYWLLQGAGWWSVELRETGEVVGTVGAFYREHGGDLELGWTLYRRFWNQGLATEAARAALEYGIETQRARRVVAHISPENVASVRVAEHLGMRYERDVDFYGERIGLWALSVGGAP